MDKSQNKRSVSVKIKRYFLSGILVVVPLFATVYVLYFIFKKTDSILQPYITRSLGLYIPGLGIVLTLLIIFIIGILAHSFFAQRLLRLGERVLISIPLAGNIYNSTKQILSAFTKKEEGYPKKVVLVPYPSEGLWAIGFLNGEVKVSGGPSMGLVLLLNSINPTTGILALVDIDKIKATNLEVEEAMKLIISGGILRTEDIDRKIFPMSVS